MPIAPAGSLQLAYEVHGHSEDPAVLLVAGLGRQLIFWPYGLVHAIVVAGYRVVRFDNRDAGLSTHLSGKLNLSAVSAALRNGETPQVPYLLGDMADDAAALLDHLRIESAHVIGVSMGGAIAQEMAIRHADRVTTLIPIMATTGASDVGQPNARGNRALFRAPPPDRDGAIESALAAARLLASPGAFDATRARMQAAWEHDRAFDPEGVGRQLGAIWASGDRTPALRSLAVPALVIHGADDPLVPPSGGCAIAAAIPRARYVEIPEMAHDLPEAHWPAILDPMLGMFRGGG